MIAISKEVAEQLFGMLAGFEASAGAPPGSLDRLARAVRLLAGLEEGPPVDPLQRPNFLLPGLTAQPFWDAARFADVRRLEAAAATIRGELLALRRRQVFGAEPESDLVAAGTWAQFDFSINGRRLDENCALCPETAAVLDSLEAVQGCDLMLFSANVPGTHIRPHCGPHNARLRCHLGLVVPEGCSMRVGSEVRTWEEGRCLVFDDSFEHEVWNRGEGTRVVLLVDFWHPELTPIEQLAFQQLSGAVRSLMLAGDDQVAAKLDRWRHVQERTDGALPAGWWV